ncbi:hypothetical protein ADUPG1_001616, partial [Aduncisulcus paluster]
SNIQPQIQYITQESSLPSTTKTSPTQTSGSSSSSSSRPTIGVQDRPFTVLHNKLSTLKQRLKEKEKEVAVLRGDLLSKKAQYEDNSTKMTEKYKSDIKILQEKLKEKIKECNISASQHKEELGTISKQRTRYIQKNETARRKRWVESKTKELRISIAQTYKDKIEEIVRDHKKELLAKDTKYAEEIFHLKEELKDQYSLQIDEARRDSSTRAAAEVSEREGEKIRNLERLLDQTKEDLMRVKLESEA